MEKRGCPYSTGCPFSTKIRMTSPETSDSISFMSFIASTMQSACPVSTCAPTFTKASAPGLGDSYSVPTMGDLTRYKSSLERPSAAPGTLSAEVSGFCTEPGTIISGAATAREAPTTAPADGLRSRMLRSPREYSNSSRLCSVMNWRSCSICWISGLANDGLDFVGFLRFMPVLNLDEIPRCAGQYFRSVSMHDHIIFDANPPNAFRVHAWFNCNYVAGLQMPLLPSRQPGVFMHFEPKPMARAVHKQMANAVRLQNLSCSCIDIPTGRAVLYRCNGCGLCFQDGLIPGSDASSGPPHKHRAGYITAIVAEYNNQVQHDQLIFPQSFGRWTRVWKSSPFPESDDCFERGARGAELAHLVFNLCRRLQFSNSRLEETDSSLHNLYCKNGRFSHLRDFCRVLAHS